MLCLRSRSRIRIRPVLLGMLTGLGMASVLFMWTKGDAYMKDHSGMVKGIVVRDVSYHSLHYSKAPIASTKFS